MTGAELKQVVNAIDDDATILGVNASHGDVKRHLTTFYANMAMVIDFEVSVPVPGALLAEEVLAKAREAAKAATSYKGLFQTLLRLVAETFPSTEAMEAFSNSPQAAAMRSILNEAEKRFEETV